MAPKWLLLLAFIVLGEISPAQDGALTGRSFEKTVMEMPVRVDWFGAGWRSQVIGLANTQRIGVWIDRRVDPDRILELRVPVASFAQVLWLAAESHEHAVAQWDDFFFVGPPNIVAGLPQRISQLRVNISESNFNQKFIKAWQKPVEVQGDKYCEPRDLVNDWSQTAGVTISNLDQIPHDVWNDFRLPRMPLVEAVALVVVGFDLWPEPQSDGSLLLVPLPTIETISREWKSSAKLAAFWKEMQDRFPNLQMEDTASGKKITGDVLAINGVARCWVFRETLKADASLERRYSLTTQATRGALLATIANQLGVRFDPDPAFRQQLTEIVSIEIENGSIEALLTMVLEGSPFRYELSESELRIIEKSK